MCDGGVLWQVANGQEACYAALLQACDSTADQSVLHALGLAHSIKPWVHHFKNSHKKSVDTTVRSGGVSNSTTPAPKHQIIFDSGKKVWDRPDEEGRELASGSENVPTACRQREVIRDLCKALTINEHSQFFAESLGGALARLSHELYSKDMYVLASDFTASTVSFMPLYFSLFSQTLCSGAGAECRRQRLHRGRDTQCVFYHWRRCR